MTRILYNLETLALSPYPREDDEPVIGLQPPLVELVVIQQEPPSYDPATQRLEGTATLDLEGRTLTRGWQIAQLPPLVPLPDWLGFAEWLFVFPPFAQAMDAARGSSDPQGEPATTALPAALQEARLNQNYPAWAATWGQFLLASQMPANALAEIIGRAQACHLPAEFLATLQPFQSQP